MEVVSLTYFGEVVDLLVVLFLAKKRNWNHEATLKLTNWCKNEPKITNFLAHLPVKTNPANIREKLRDFVKRRSLDRPNPTSPTTPKRNTVSKTQLQSLLQYQQLIKEVQFRFFNKTGKNLFCVLSENSVPTHLSAKILNSLTCHFAKEFCQRLNAE